MLMSVASPSMLPDSFSVHLTRKAQKDLDDLRGFADRATNAILKLEADPQMGHELRGSLRGARSLEFSLPGGAYRAAYVVLEKERVCLVFMIAPHENFYREATRRMAVLQRSGTV